MMESSGASESTDAVASTDVFASLVLYGGFDWGKEHQQFALVDRQGSVLANFRFGEDAAGWKEMAEKLDAHLRQSLGQEKAERAKVGVAIETSCGWAVERLLEMGVVVYPINPKSAERYRDRKWPAGVKDDERDAWSLADALRTDGHGWRELRPLDPATTELRILCRDEIGLIEQRTALVLQLEAALHEYYPAALKAFEDWTAPSAWEFVLSFPDPHRLVSAGKRKWEKFLHAHRLYRPQTAPKRLEVFAQAEKFMSPNSAVVRAKSLLAVSLAKQLVTLAAQLEEYRVRIGELFNNHPDRGCFGSLPGAGEKLAPRLLGELGNDRRRFESFESLQAYAGTAPVRQQSGNKWIVRMRWSCNPTLRTTVHLWADLSRFFCAWAQAYYRQKRDQGMKHAAALRCLGQRWLKILWTMWQTGEPYDEAYHSLNQVKHGSWVVGLKQPVQRGTKVLA